MTISVTKPSVNLREKLNELDQPQGLKGTELLRADTVAEARSLIGAGRKNLIINGGMDVWQRGTSFTHSDSYWTDRWHRSWSLNGALDSEQSTDAPVGFAKSLKVTVDTPSTDNFNHTEYFAVGQYIEKKNIQQLAYGTSSAKSITVSFWVKASSTATYSVGLRAKFTSAGNTYYTASRSFTINTADTWEYKTVTFAGNQTDYVNWDWGDDYGIAVYFALSVGDIIGNAYDDGEWHLGNGFGLTSTTTGCNFATLSSGETIQFTGVQLELGSVATEFEHRSYGEELALCQRYYLNLDETRVHIGGSSGTGSSYDWYTPIMYPVEMRVVPTATYSYTGDGATSNGFFIEGTAKHYGKFSVRPTRTSECNVTADTLRLDAEL